MENEEIIDKNQVLDLAAQRRREKQVVDVEVERSLIVVFHLESKRSSVSSPLAADAGLYGLPASAVESIVPVTEITFVPGTPRWILGVVNVRGDIESVLELRTVLGLGDREITPQSRLLIARDGELRSGLLVDEMVDIVEIPATDISPPPTPLEGGKGVYIVGEAQYKDSTLILLNLAEIFRQALETDRV